ncbi:DUF488 domain-containing protein, partial [Candidatus Woesearchaeota archaeon]|nr:DUF488 domain-containing protein [Candidatus Woesearchaeota archaeon]
MPAALMTLYTKCILAPVLPEDGKRVSVMSKHTLNDGVTPHPQITPDHYQSHMPGLAPPLKLIGSYYKRGLPWQEFESAYKEFLQTPGVAEQVKSLAHQSLTKDITLLCIEETPEKCHRRLLAEACKA